MGSNSSQPPAELSDEDVEFISSKAKIDHESVKVWYEKLKVGLRLLLSTYPYSICSHRQRARTERFRKLIQ